MLYKLFFVGVAFFVGTAIYSDPIAGFLLAPFGWLVGKAMELNHLLRRQLSSPALVRTVASQKEERISVKTVSSDVESSEHNANQGKEPSHTQMQQNYHDQLIEQVAEAVARKMAGRFLTQEDLITLKQLLDEAKALRAELLFQQKDRDTSRSKYLH